MILQNITRAIRTQNWFAVAIEFVIVILGVVIGFQITAWASDRADAERRAVALDRLHDEIENSINILVVVSGRYEELNAARTEVIERLVSGGNLDGIDTGLNRTAAIATSFHPAFSPPQGVYSEIISSGMLSSLGDAAFRDALGDYQARIVFLQGQIDNSRLVATTRAGLTDFDYVRLEYAPGTMREVGHVIDWEAAANDPEFLQYLLAGHNPMRSMHRWWEDTLESARAVCAETGRLTGRTCEPPDGPVY